MVKKSHFLTAALFALVGCSNGQPQVEVTTKQIKNPPVFISVPPTKLADGRDVRPGLPYRYVPLLDQTDPAGGLSIRAVRLPQHAAWTDGGVTWLPGLEQAGFGSDFELEATNGYGLVTRQAWRVPVEPRLAPTGAGVTAWSSGSPTEFHAFSWNVVFADEDKGSVTAQIQAPAGATYDPATRLLTWVPPAGSAGERAIELDLTNNVGLKAHVTARITVGANKGPSLTTAQGGISAPEGTFLSVPYQVVDPEGDPLALSKLTARVILFGETVSPGPSVAYEPATKTALVNWDIPVGTLLTGSSAQIEVRAEDIHGTASLTQTPLTVGDRLAPRISAQAGSPTAAVEAKSLTAFFTITVPVGNTVQTETVKATARDVFGQLVEPQPNTVWSADTRTAAVTWTPAKGAPYLNSSVLWSLEAKDQNFIRGTLDYRVDAKQHTPPSITAVSGGTTSAKVGAYIFNQYKITTFDGEGLVQAANAVTVAALVNGVAQTPAPTVSLNNGVLTVAWTIPGGLTVGQTVQIKVAAKDTLGFTGEAFFPITISN